MKLSEDLKETYDGMIEDGTGFYDVIKIIGNAAYEAEQLESRIATLEEELKNMKQYAKLLIVGHDFQCNSREGLVCDCGVDQADALYDAQHPYRQAAIEIIERLIEPRMKSKKGLNGEEYYAVEDEIVMIISKQLTFKNETL